VATGLQTGSMCPAGAVADAWYLHLPPALSPIPPSDRLFQTLLPHPMRGDRGRKEGLSFHGATRQRVGLPLEIFGQTVVLLQMWVAFFCVCGGNIIFIVIETFITMVSEGRRPTRKRKVCIEIHPARRTHVCFSTRHFELTAWQNAQIEDEVAPKRPPLPHLPHVYGCSVLVVRVATVVHGHCRLFMRVHVHVWRTRVIHARHTCASGLIVLKDRGKVGEGR